ncbi:dTDP-4-dehydrorhamnose reductase [Zobellia nedashkovskayae]|uniref:dTDP-4-dehydrorhamnose reductase n=1 Tax=Zobellia nedashkovskayae TaxID=2779510 RepID=UPI00188BF062|nr:dTDP-4-dehydrorhamnose reductase [Zobellia nedashkovskayae]
MKSILVTGGSGQLATCVKELSEGYNNLEFVFMDSAGLDISQKEQIAEYFETNTVDYCVNCAAYTAVDKAESEEKLAKAINTNGAKNLAEACKENNSVLIQISTDFVFDGKKTEPYNEKDGTAPLNIYGSTKRDGEIAISSTMKEYFILRTAWLYSEYGNNFLKTMLRLGSERKELNVVCDQIGTPTYAKDLAKVIMKIISEDIKEFGLYHFSNEGQASWSDFAKAIFEESDKNVKVKPIPTSEYPTAAERPMYSVLDKSKIKNKLGVQTSHWTKSLNDFFKRTTE